MEPEVNINPNEATVEISSTGTVTGPLAAQQITTLVLPTAGLWQIEAEGSVALGAAPGDISNMEVGSVAPAEIFGRILGPANPPASLSARRRYITAPVTIAIQAVANADPAAVYYANLRATRIN